MSRASTVTKSAALSTDFGLSYASALFGKEAIESIPLLKSGPNKGKPKGHIVWLRTTSAGYHPNAGGGVREGVTVRAWIAEHSLAPESSAMMGKWLGRTQTLCGSACVLGPAARSRWEADEKRRQDELNAAVREIMS